jgi:hypothetical protein
MDRTFPSYLVHTSWVLIKSIVWVVGTDVTPDMANACTKVRHRNEGCNPKDIGNLL